MSHAHCLSSPDRTSEVVFGAHYFDAEPFAATLLLHNTPARTFGLLLPRAMIDQKLTAAVAVATTHAPQDFKTQFGSVCWLFV